MTLFGRIKTVAPVWNGDTVNPQSVLEKQREHKPTSTIQNSAASELSRQSDQVHGRSDITESLADLAIQQTARWFFKQQNTDGHWRGPLEGDTILESEYLLICGWAGRLDQSTMSGCSNCLLYTSPSPRD